MILTPHKKKKKRVLSNFSSSFISKLTLFILFVFVFFKVCVFFFQSLFSYLNDVTYSGMPTLFRPIDRLSATIMGKLFLF